MTDTPQPTPLTDAEISVYRATLPELRKRIDNDATGDNESQLGPILYERERWVATITQLRAENAAMVEALKAVADSSANVQFLAQKPIDAWRKADDVAKDPTAAGKALLERLEKAEAIVAGIPAQMEEFAQEAEKLEAELERLQQNQIPAGCVVVCATCGRKQADWPKYDCVAAPDCPLNATPPQGG